MKLVVECYSGFKANERPMRFCLDGQWRLVQEVVDRWYGPDYSYFRVRGNDGGIYLLRLDETTREWSLSGSRQGLLAGDPPAEL